MLIIIISRLLIVSFPILIAWFGFRWHIGFTVQNRYSWVMMDNRNGSSKARTGVFFLAAGFAFTAMFESGNAIAGGINLAGLFPRYVDIRRGANITFVAAWCVQLWQLINRATTFIAVLSSFSVFLAPIIGIMATNYYLLRRGRSEISHLYKIDSSIYYFWKGFNVRAIPAWTCGWAPTIGGLVVTVRGDTSALKALVKLYYMAFLVGFFISAIVFYRLNLIFPVPDMDQMDSVDVYGLFTAAEARRIGVAPLEEVSSAFVITGISVEP